MVFPVVSGALAELPGITHGYFTREGGVSKGPYDSLNIGFGSRDDRDAVTSNRARITDYLGVAPGRLFTPYQIHSAEAAFAETDFADGAPKADAVVTSSTGTAIGVATADCGSVLFADPASGVIGAAHAGWRGAFTGILEATLEAMESRGGRRAQTIAVLGPTISAASYEVGPEFVERFHRQDPGNSVYFTPSQRDGHAYFDLPAYIIARLRKAGVAAAHDLGHCTYLDEKRFYSYRRSVHRGEPDYGRLLSAIVLNS